MLKHPLSHSWLFSMFVLVLLVFGCAAPSTGCGSTLGERAGDVAGDVIDCLTPTASQAIAQFGPAIATVVRSATSHDGHVDWQPVRDIGASLTTPAAQCVLASVIAATLAPALPRRPGEPQSSPLVTEHASLVAGWESQRAAWGGHRYRLATGTL